ncbi:hypothetical protein RJ639_019052 [Escallonia herrerae]|uniref:Uncharacterized protein n=1 Tax=Escallonia herrerae TaxID=1293975 RepID=A0AA89AK40_9ASTE|nr:hypothetical protein RJ639_019052 [Escallonia herrerae]
MATTATTMWSVLVLLIAFMAGYCLSSPALPISDISAAPAILPNAPLSSPVPTLSPDITPLFPSPSGSGLSPSESSLPIIPSSPSPPNPDDMFAPGPSMVIAPSGSLPFSSANVPGSLSTSVMDHQPRTHQIPQGHRSQSSCLILVSVTHSIMAS